MVASRLRMALANDACKALSLVIIQQDATKFVVVMDEPFSCPQIGTVMCTGLEFSFAPDFKLAEQMYVWPSDLTAKMPPKIKSLQHSDVSPDDLEASRSRFKSELTAASVVLNQELTLSLGDGFSAGYMVGIINGQVIARSELIKNIVSKAETIDTSCIVESQTLKALPKFQRKLGKLEVRHVNRTEGLWIFDQLHAGLDSILTPEQRRAPSEHKFSMTEIRKSVTITVEAADSEKNGKGTKIDNDLKITCDKNREGGPIGIDDLKKAFGNVITFSK
ncbi:MAG: hypothetical protein NTX25_11010 [Proteobacteria bacterium]|nr:hypothetical protein [Pseudomonadota bacterium]